MPIILFTKGGGAWLSEMAQDELRCARRRLDDGSRRRAQAPCNDSKALQGNLDPSCLYASPERIREEVARVLASYGKGHGHVFNLGHGIHPQIPPEHAGAMIPAVHELSPHITDQNVEARQKHEHECQASA